jgi:hypothetical protein
VPRIEFLERETGQVYALFNTNNADQGPANARRLVDVLNVAGIGEKVVGLERMGS